MIKGLDNGYLKTKDNEKRIFTSAYTIADSTMSDITIDGVDYSVGAGKMSIEVDKTDQEINKVCTLYNLKQSGDFEYFLVVGLPIGQFRLQRDKFTKMVFGYNDCEVLTRGVPYKFKINDVLVFPQGIGALLTAGYTDGDFIIFDIGGLTIDIAYVTMCNGAPIMQKYDTWYKGMQLIYSDIIHAVNNRFNMTLEPSYAEKIFTNGLKIDGITQDLSFLDSVKNNFLEPILTEFQLNYPAKTTQIYLCGGGSNILYGTFRARYKSVILLQDSQFANAIGFYKVGCQKWSKYINAQRKGVML